MKAAFFSFRIGFYQLGGLSNCLLAGSLKVTIESRAGKWREVTLSGVGRFLAASVALR